MGSSSDPIAAVFSEMSGQLSEELVKKTNAVYSFSLSDKKTQYYLDLKNGGGACGEGNPAGDVDATLTMTSANFQKMFSGKLKPTTAFMSGRLKISGNISGLLNEDLVKKTDSVSCFSLTDRKTEYF